MLIVKTSQMFKRPISKSVRRHLLLSSRLVNWQYGWQRVRLTKISNFAVLNFKDSPLTKILKYDPPIASIHDRSCSNCIRVFSRLLTYSYVYSRIFTHILVFSIQDAVPKTIMHFIVNDVKDSLQGYLVKRIYKVASPRSCKTSVIVCTLYQVILTRVCLAGRGGCNEWSAHRIGVHCAAEKRNRIHAPRLLKSRRLTQTSPRRINVILTPDNKHTF